MYNATYCRPCRPFLHGCLNLSDCTFLSILLHPAPKQPNSPWTQADGGTVLDVTSLAPTSIHSEPMTTINQASYPRSSTSLTELAVASSGDPVLKYCRLAAETRSMNNLSLLRFLCFFFPSHFAVASHQRDIISTCDIPTQKCCHQLSIGLCSEGHGGFCE